MPSHSTPTMKANLLEKKSTMKVVEMPIPELPPGGLLIRTKSVGICGSDVIKVLNTVSTEERVIGHEITGEVVKIDERATIAIIAAMEVTQCASSLRSHT